MERGGEGMGRGMGLSIADIPLAAFRRDDRLGKIDLCRGSSRWMGQSTKSISHHPHDIGPLSRPFLSSLRSLWCRQVRPIATRSELTNRDRCTVEC